MSLRLTAPTVEPRDEPSRQARRDAAGVGDLEPCIGDDEVVRLGAVYRDENGQERLVEIQVDASDDGLHVHLERMSPEAEQLAPTRITVGW